VVRRAPKPHYEARIPAPPDVRHPMCKPELEKLRAGVGLPRMPNTSVIFCFCNEPAKSLYVALAGMLCCCVGLPGLTLGLVPKVSFHSFSD
jgi:hypothetical protein